MLGGSSWQKAGVEGLEKRRRSAQSSGKTGRIRGRRSGDRPVQSEAVLHGDSTTIPKSQGIFEQNSPMQNGQPTGRAASSKLFARRNAPGDPGEVVGSNRQAWLGKPLGNRNSSGRRGGTSRAMERYRQPGRFRSEQRQTQATNGSAIAQRREAVEVGKQMPAKPPVNRRTGSVFLPGNILKHIRAYHEIY